MLQQPTNLQLTSSTSTSTISYISSLMHQIQLTTTTMNQTFQQSILKHQEQFIKAYKIKIYELTKLFHQLKRNIQDKFINNAITQQLQTVIKERDYFKYECLKLNTQYKNVLDDYKNLTQQMVNVNEQMGIYKHLLQNEKIKSSEIQKNAKRLKNNLTELASKTIQDSNFITQSKSTTKLSVEEKQQISKLKKQLKEKTQTIRMLKAKNQQIEEFAQNRFTMQQQRKELQQVFSWCVQTWKREIMIKSRKFSSNKYSNINVKPSISLNHCTAEQFSSSQKKDLLQMLFTHPQFLQFLQKLLFDKNFQVNFVEITDQGKKDEILIKNRNKLYDLMKRKGLVSSVINKPGKFR